jgi:hypothetical protein
MPVTEVIARGHLEYPDRLARHHRRRIDLSGEGVVVPSRIAVGKSGYPFLGRAEAVQLAQRHQGITEVSRVFGKGKGIERSVGRAQIEQVERQWKKRFSAGSTGRIVRCRQHPGDETAILVPRRFGGRRQGIGSEKSRDEKQDQTFVH